MRRLIDAEVLKSKIATCITVESRGKNIYENLVRFVLETVRDVIDAQPTIDAVQVIRCKDCARNPNNGKARTICPCPMDRYMGPEGYCSKAEPKEADG